ncbi:TRI15 protein, partial [Podargus strigoides]|nr:TRI15 protein [Podargus strigoides]
LLQQEGVVLAQLDRAHTELTRQRQEYVCGAAERKSLLDTLIVEIEKKRDQPAVEFLTLLSLLCPPSCEAVKAPIPAPVSPELQRTVKRVSEMSQLVMGAVVKFKGKAKQWVTLDPETASPFLLLSKDCRTVRLGDGQQKLSNSPKRFTGSPSVLGAQG